MASSPRQTNKFNFGEEGITNDKNNDQHHEGNRDNDDDEDKPLLYTKLRHTPSTPSNPISRPLSFSYSHSYSYSHSRSNSISIDIPEPSPEDDDDDNDHNHKQMLQPIHDHSHSYPTPRDSTDSLSSPLTLFKLQKWLKEHNLDSIYNKLIVAGLYDM